jgi:hypothetical protein
MHLEIQKQTEKDILHYRKKEYGMKNFYKNACDKKLGLSD